MWQWYKLFDRLIYWTSKLDAEKITHSSATSASLMKRTVQLHVQLHNYKCMTSATAQLRLKSGLLMTNQIQEFWYSYDYNIHSLIFSPLPLTLT